MATERLRPRISPLLSREHLDALHGAALQVLDEIGLHVADEACLTKLAGTPGITRRGSRLHFAPEFVAAHVQAMLAATPEPSLDDGDAAPTMTVGGHATHYVDWETDEVIPLTWEACESITRIVDALSDRGLIGSCPGSPQEVPVGLRQVAQCLIGWENSRHGGTAPATSLNAAEFVFEMARAMGAPYGVGIHIVSPLRLEGVEWEMAKRFATRPDGDRVSLSVASMPIMGASAPIHPLGAFTLAVAEVLGAWLAVKLYLEREYVGFSFDAYSMDLSTGAFIYGNPEQKLVDLIKRDVNAYYHAHKLGRSMYSMAKRPGVQSGAEMAMLATVDALSGQRRFLGCQLAVDEICSPEQYALCLDIMNAASHLADGLEFSEEALGLSAIREAMAEGSGESFLAADTTLRHHREVYWQPRYWDRTPRSMSAWASLEPARMRAKQDVREALAKHDFTLDGDHRRELRAIYSRAEQHFRG